MGNGIGDFNAYEKFMLGWLPRATHVRANGEYTIDGLEGPSAGAKALVVQTALEPSPEWALAAFGASAFLLVAALAYPSGMGMGDVKLAGVMGLYLGASVAPALLAGFAAGALVGVGIIARHGAEGRKRGVPFAPFLALGGLLGLLAGPELVDLYADRFLS